jgi:hypothetical protein
MAGKQGELSFFETIPTAPSPDLVPKPLLYTNKVYSKILHLVTDKVMMLQTSNVRSYILL